MTRCGTRGETLHCGAAIIILQADSNPRHPVPNYLDLWEHLDYSIGIFVFMIGVVAPFT